MDRKGEPMPEKTTLHGTVAEIPSFRLTLLTFALRWRPNDSFPSQRSRF